MKSRYGIPHFHFLWSYVRHITILNLTVLYLQSSPPSFCAAGRTGDLQSILSVMEDAQEFIYIAVMNYLPTMEFSRPKRSAFCFNVLTSPKFTICIRFIINKAHKA